MDIYRGTYRIHVSSRTLVAKAFQAGFYWPTAHKDAEDIVRKYEGYQTYTRHTHVSAAELKTIPIACLFSQWGLNMVELLSQARGGFTHLLAVVDKFTNWIEAKPITTCDGSIIVNFIRRIIFQFGIPHSIITDNGSIFTSAELHNFCSSQVIRLDYTSVAHPQLNGQVERLQGIKPRLLVPLKRAAGVWVNELPSILWSLRMTLNRSTGYALFFMVYGAEAVMPADIVHDSPRVPTYAEADSEEACRDALDPVDETRDLALSRSAIYQQNLHRYHSR